MRLKMISSAGAEAFPPVPLIVMGPRERMRLAFQRGGLFLGLALAAVFIPVFHFVLVPLFLIIAVVAALRARKARAIVAPFDANCLKCDKPVHFKRMVIEEEVRTFCPECRDQMKLTVV